MHESAWERDTYGGQFIQALLSSLGTMSLQTATYRDIMLRIAPNLRQHPVALGKDLDSLIFGDVGIVEIRDSGIDR
jgi:hypothetical protein